MAFIELLSEMLTRSQVADLAKNVAVVSLDREKKGNPKKFLNLFSAESGKVDWVDARPGIFKMKGKIIRDILPLVKGKIGNYTFMDRDAIENDYDMRSVSSIQTDSPSFRFGTGSDD